jgi:tellurite resistance-related uncharacterized protein
LDPAFIHRHDRRRISTFTVTVIRKVHSISSVWTQQTLTQKAFKKYNTEIGTVAAVVVGIQQTTIGTDNVRLAATSTATLQQP